MARIRPGLVLAVDGAATLVVQMMENGDIVGIKADGGLTSISPDEKMTVDELPTAGSAAADVIADAIAGLFGMHPDTAPYAAGRKPIEVPAVTPPITTSPANGAHVQLTSAQIPKPLACGENVDLLVLLEGVSCALR